MKKFEMVNSFFNDSMSVDLSPLLENGIPRALTHPPLIINPSITHEHDGYYCQTIFIAEHIGSHVDAPYHIHAAMSKDTIDVAPVNALIGSAKVFDVSDLELKPGEVLKLEEIKRIEKEKDIIIKEKDIILVNFGYAKKYWSIKNWKYFSSNAPGLSKEIAKYFYHKKIKAIGSDTFACGTPTIDGKEGYCFIHNMLLKERIYLMECLQNLEKLPAEVFFVAAPLKIKNGSGSPIRALAFF